jgi:hypothetical protein
MPQIVKDHMVGSQANTASLHALLSYAKSLVDEPSGSEYERGILDLLAFAFGEPNVTTDERMIELAKRLGWPTEWKGVS